MCALTTALLVPLARTPFAVALSSPPVDTSADCVATATLASVRAIDGSGHESTPTSFDGLGRAYHYHLHGSDLVEVIPPPGWSPVRASDRELATYQIPTRPTQQAERSAWNARFTSWSSHGPVGMCETSRRNGLTHVTTSPNWAGGMSVNGSATVGTFYQNVGDWTQPSFVGGCPNSSGYSIWAGLGGYNSGRLLQSGTSIDGGTNALYEWWELLSPQHNNAEVRFIGGTNAVHGGDKVQSFNSYSASAGSITMGVINIANGETHAVTVTSYNGQAASGYYDGTTSDFVTEAPTNGNGNIMDLRQPVGNSTYYYYATTNGNPISSYPSWRINELGVSTGRTMQSSGFDGVHAWRDTWNGCR
jgi:hypothetical protein